MNNNSIGQTVKDGHHGAIRGLVMLLGIFVYLGFILYSGVHNWRLLTTGVPADMVVVAAVGVLALEITALALPLAIHFWTHAPDHKLAAYIFYVADFVLIIGNVVVDYTANTGGTPPGWLDLYLHYIVPATPIICGIGWTILFLLDPSQKERASIENYKAATRETLRMKIMERAAAQDITELVDDAADKLARSLVEQTLGQSLANHGAKTKQLQPPRTPTLPSPTEGYTPINGNDLAAGQHTASPNGKITNGPNF